MRAGLLGRDHRPLTGWRGYDDLTDRSRERPPPAEDAPALDWLRYEQSSVLTRRQALSVLSEDALRHRVAIGAWQRVRAGIYVGQSGPLTDEQNLWSPSCRVARVPYSPGPARPVLADCVVIHLT